MSNRRGLTECVPSTAAVSLRREQMNLNYSAVVVHLSTLQEDVKEVRSACRLGHPSFIDLETSSVLVNQ